jgi:excisionase family DNA binding protein
MTPNETCRKLLTIEQAAEQLSVKPATIRSWILKREKLEVVKVGRLIRIKESSVQRFIDVGENKYDESAAAIIAQLKYGSGTPFHRLEQLEKQLGIPLPAATQWEIVEQAAHPIKPARDELIRQAAQ